jgi:hypothetical protein
LSGSEVCRFGTTTVRRLRDLQRPEVLVQVAVLLDLLEVLEALERRRLLVLGLVVRVLLVPARGHRGDVVVVGEHEELRRPRLAVALDDWVDPGLLDLGVVRHELVPRLGDLEAELLVDLLVVEDAPAEGAAERGAVDLVVRRHARQERLVGGLDERLVGERLEVLLRLEGLEERARVVGEHVGHVLSGQPRLDDVVAVGALGARLDLDRDVRVLRVERVHDPLGRLESLIAVVDQERQRDLLVAAARRAAPVVRAAAARDDSRSDQNGEHDGTPEPAEHHLRPPPHAGMPRGVGHSPTDRFITFQKAVAEP